MPETVVIPHAGRAQRCWLLCGFCGGRLDEPGAELIHPVPGSGDGTLSKKACAKCAPEQRKLQQEQGLLLGKIIRPDRVHRDIPAGDETITDVPAKKVRSKPVKQAVQPAASSLLGALISALSSGPLDDPNLLKLVAKAGVATDIRKLQQGMYKLRNQGKVVKDGNKWLLIKS